MVDAGAAWAVVEATSHGLAMHRLDHVAFRIGAVTNITHEHLDFHGTVDKYRRAKALLVERVGHERRHGGRQRGRCWRVFRDPIATGAEVIRFSMTGADAEVRAELEAHGGKRQPLRAATPGTSASAECQLPLIGEFNVANALCAAAVALAAGVDSTAIADALATAPPVPGRMAPVEAGQPFRVVVDYAHTPDSMAKVLPLLRGLHPQGG